MNEVYKLIDTGNISIIYSFALDRIGRDEAFLVNFKNTCIAKRVQLKTINPYMFLLNDYSREITSIKNHFLQGGL